MKTINTKTLKEKLDKVLDLQEIYESHEEELYSPCWQIQVNREESKLVFLIDANKVMSFPLNNLDQTYLTVSNLSDLIKILREGDLKKLKNALLSVSL